MKHGWRKAGIYKVAYATYIGNGWTAYESYESRALHLENNECTLNLFIKKPNKTTQPKTKEKI